MHRATTLAELANDREPKRFLVEASGAGHIAHVQRGFKNATGFRMHHSLPAGYLTVSDSRERSSAHASTTVAWHRRAPLPLRSPGTSFRTIHTGWPTTRRRICRITE